MILNFKNMDASYFEFASVSAKVKEVNKINGSNSGLEEKTFFKRASEDQKNRIVSEKTETARAPHEYSQRLKSNSPASHSQKSAKTFHEIKNHDHSTSYNEEDIIEIEETDDYEKVRNSGGGNFYIVIDENENRAEEPKIKTPNDLWRDRILKTYNFGMKKEPGILVNLTI